MFISIMNAISSLGCGDEVVRIAGDTYEGIEWLNEPKLTKEEVENELIRLKSQYELDEYKSLRVSEYPTIGDQLDALYHAGVFPPEMAQKIKEIKDKYPKPSTN